MNKTVLYCVLNWGLGHATRSVPVIQELLDQKLKVVLASDGRSGAFLKKYFPKLTYVELPAYPIEYPKRGSMKMKALQQAPKLVNAVKDEHEAVLKLVREYNIDGIISDNRYGAYAPGVHSVFIGHQLTIQAGLMSRIVNKLNHKWMSEFEEVWVPDNEGDNNLSGKLSHPAPIYIDSVIRYIGFLSRFKEKKIGVRKYHIAAVVSGPEPQRGILEEKLIQLFVDMKTSNIIIAGKPEVQQNDSIPNLKLLAHADDRKFSDIVHSSKVVITRPGYSSLMDYMVMGAALILVPTPGQTEQVYLAKQLNEQFGVPVIQQSKLTAKTLNEAVKKAKVLPHFESADQLKKMVGYFKVSL